MPLTLQNSMKITRLLHTGATCIQLCTLGTHSSWSGRIFDHHKQQERNKYSSPAGVYAHACTVMNIDHSALWSLISFTACSDIKIMQIFACKYPNQHYHTSNSQGHDIYSQAIKSISLELVQLVPSSKAALVDLNVEAWTIFSWYPNCQVHPSAPQYGFGNWNWHVLNENKLATSKNATNKSQKTASFTDLGLNVYYFQHGKQEKSIQLPCCLAGRRTNTMKWFSKVRDPRASSWTTWLTEQFPWPESPHVENK